MLFVGGEVLVRGAAALARHLGLPLLVIGLTVVALGTSAPEIVVSIQAALSNHPDVAAGNIIGSNIANIFLVLGISAIIYPVVADKTVIRRDAPIMLILSVIFVYFSMNSNSVDFTEGALLAAAGVAYISYTLWDAYNKKPSEIQHEIEEIKEDLPPDITNPKAILFVVAGCVLLAVGADTMVTGAVELAGYFGISEGVVGATIVAVGSSAPELATCIVSACRRHTDLLIGNIVGSNLLNIMAGISIAALVANPLEINLRFIEFDNWYMLAATIMLILFLFGTGKINRPTGMMFFTLYLGYIGWQFI